MELVTIDESKHAIIREYLSRASKRIRRNDIPFAKRAYFRCPFLRQPEQHQADPEVGRTK